MPLVRVCQSLNPGVKHLGLARAPDVPLLDPTVRVGYEIDEPYSMHCVFFTPFKKPNRIEST